MGQAYASFFQDREIEPFRLCPSDLQVSSFLECTPWLSRRHQCNSGAKQLRAFLPKSHHGWIQRRASKDLFNAPCFGHLLISPHWRLGGKRSLENPHKLNSADYQREKSFNQRLSGDLISTFARAQYHYAFGRRPIARCVHRGQHVRTSGSCAQTTSQSCQPPEDEGFQEPLPQKLKTERGGSQYSSATRCRR